MTTKHSLAILATVGLLAASGTIARAQEEDDHAGVKSGLDPKTEQRAPLRMQEPEAQVAGENLQKTFGIGYGQTPGGVRGLEIEYYLGDLVIDAHAALLFMSPKGGGDSGSSFAFAGGLFYRWRVWDNLAVMLGGRLDVGHASDSGTATPGKLPQPPGGYGGGGTQINLEVPLRAELYFGGVLSVHAEVGPVLVFVTDGVGVIGDSWAGESKGTYLDIPELTQIASFGVTFYLQ